MWLEAPEKILQLNLNSYVETLFVVNIFRIYSDARTNNSGSYIEVYFIVGAKA